jgi:hypothetical protein
VNKYCWALKRFSRSKLGPRQPVFLLFKVNASPHLLIHTLIKEYSGISGGSIAWFLSGRGSELLSFLCLEAEKVRCKVVYIQVVYIQRIYNLFILIIFIVNKFLR